MPANISMFAKVISALVLAAASLSALAENRIILEQDVTKFSSKYWSSDSVPVDSDIVKVLFPPFLISF